MTEITLYFELPIDYLTFQLRQQFHKLSENELKLLAIIYLSGLNADIKKEVVNRQIFKSLQTVENHLSRFRKEKILVDNKIQLKFPISKMKETSIKLNLKIGASPKDS